MATDADTETHLLVVDDEPTMRRLLVAALEREGVNVQVASGGREAVTQAKRMERLDVLVTDLLMPERDGLEVMQSVRRLHPNVQTVFVSGQATIRTAVEAMRLGAFDFVVKPFEVEQLREVVARAAQVNRASQASGGTPGTAERPADITVADAGGKTKAPASRGRRTKSDGPVTMIGDAPMTRELRSQLTRAALSRATVLLLGESGTGKEVAARLLHDLSVRREGPFIAVSCAALPESLLESELFGYEKGAFTGATAAKPGRFELANGGTLFLDEIGDIPPLTQVKLLRALQEREVSRLGSVRALPVDVRVVAATNRDLERAVREGTFRLDLYYRLQVIPIALPPLRDRREDIEPLAYYFMGRLRRIGERTFPGGITSAAREQLLAHDWPGNIRELQNAIEYAAVMSDAEGDALDIGALPGTVGERRFVELP